MAITGSNPVVVPEATYDIWWMTSFSVAANRPNGKVVARFQLIPMNSSSGAVNPAAPVNVSIGDVMALIAAETTAHTVDPSALTPITTAFNSVLTAVQAYAVEQGKI